MTVDMSGLNPIPTGGLTIDGGAGTDSLTVIGSGSTSGNVVSVNATQIIVNSSTINYANLEAIAVVTGAANDFVGRKRLSRAMARYADIFQRCGAGLSERHRGEISSASHQTRAGTFPYYFSVAVGGSTTPASIPHSPAMPRVCTASAPTLFRTSILKIMAWSRWPRQPARLMPTEPT